MPTSLLSPFERENLIGSVQPMGRFHLGQDYTGVSGRTRGPQGTNMGLDSPFTEIVLGVQTDLYEKLLMRLVSLKEFTLLKKFFFDCAVSSLWQAGSLLQWVGFLELRSVGFTYGRAQALQWAGSVSHWQPMWYEGLVALWLVGY